MARTEINMETEVPKMPKNVTRTEKGKKTKKEEVSAQFFSRYAEYKLGLVPIEERPMGAKMVVVAGSGKHIQFKNNVAMVVGEKLIQQCLKNKWFEHPEGFDIDERDPTGYWEKNGYIEKSILETTVTTRKLVKKLE